MPSSEALQCQHIKTNGTQCGSPAMRDHQFCYYHRQCRPVTFEYGRHHANFSLVDMTVPVFEDAHSIQFTLQRITELVLRHQIDQKDASLVLYALQIATSNLKRIMQEEPKPEQVVIEAPVESPDETEDEAEAPGEAVTIHACIAEPRKTVHRRACTPSYETRNTGLRGAQMDSNQRLM
jgi:hypothetical protein